MRTKILWATHVWNPIIGCSPVSEGCEKCYAARYATRHAGNPATPNYHAVLGEEIARGGHWTGVTRLLSDVLAQPLRWRKPRGRVFVCSMGDLFHEATSFEWVDEVLRMIKRVPASTFLLLTKRPRRVIRYLEWRSGFTNQTGLPFNAWLGVSAENQRCAEERVPLLLDIPAAVRFISVEPMLESVDLTGVLGRHGHVRKLDWIICGAETGAGARPMNLWWARGLRDQCAAAEVPFFFKKDSFGFRTLDGVLHEETP